MNHLLYAFFITFIAGLATVIGGLIVILIKKNNHVVVSSLAFAAGVMITVSVIDLLPEAYVMFDYLKFIPKILMILIFMNIGVILSLYLDKKVKLSDNRIYRVGIISLIAMVLHNIPEGMATFITTDTNLKLGLILSASIAIHNIPEGIIIAYPIFYATGSKKKALFYTFIAGLSELLGGIISFIFLRPFINDFILGALYSVIAGIMITISINELLPTSFSLKNKKLTYIYFVIGSLVMVFSCFIIK